MVIYIHGFGSSGRSHKATFLRALYAQGGCIAPSLPDHPDLVIQTVCELIETFQKSETVSLIGSSLGGYYALYCAQKYALRAILINPSLHPDETLQDAKAIHYYDGTPYPWNETHIEALRRYRVEVKTPQNILMLLQKGDEVLDYRDALSTLPQVSTIVEEGGSHAFEGLERYGERIEHFLSMPNDPFSGVRKALWFATQAHGEQKTPFGHPYLYHLVNVALESYGASHIYSHHERILILVSALLHDTIEDTSMGYEEVCAHFGAEVADAVLALSKNPDVGDKPAQMEDSLHRIMQQPHWVWSIKMADRITNLHGVPPHWSDERQGRYLEESYKIWAKLHEANPPLAQRLWRKITLYKETLHTP